MKRTQSTKFYPQESETRKWHLIDVSNRYLGRVSNSIASLLQGKHKSRYVPNNDSGDYVVVVNAKKVRLSGKKLSSKKYSYYSGYPGGLRTVKFETLLQTRPEEVIRHAVSGMLPKNKLRDRRLARLYVFPEETHSYSNKF